MKLSLTTTSPDISKDLAISLLSGDFPERIKKAAQLGYDGVELVVNDPSKLSPISVRSMIDNQGLEISAISTGGLFALENLTIMSGSTETKNKAISRFEKLLDFTAQVHAPILTMGSFRGKCPTQGEQLDCSFFIETMKRLSMLANDRGIKIAIEPLNRYESNYLNNVDETLTFIDVIGSPNLAVLFDTYHANIEEKSITESILKAESHNRLCHVHIGDSNRLPPGFGHINFESIFSTLKSINYQGYISVELLRKPDPDKAAAFSIEYCRPFIIE